MKEEKSFVAAVKQATYHLISFGEPENSLRAISIIVIAIAAVDRLPTAYHGTAPADSNHCDRIPASVPQPSHCKALVAGRLYAF
jgi:hypothetical protein